MKLSQQVLEILNNSQGHMSAEQMYLHCANNGIKGSVASIYRVLRKLAEDGYIRRVSIPGQPDFFDKTLNEHEHLICTCCGKVKDIKIDSLRKSIEENLNRNIESYELCIKYVCDECLEKGK